MNSLLCNWFDDWGRTIKNGLGTTGIVIFLVAFACVSLLLLYSIIKGAMFKSKIVIKWGQLILLAIFILFIIWFSIIL